MSFNNKKLIKNLYGENLIQNPKFTRSCIPNRDIVGLIKKNAKKRMPKDSEELKKLTIEEWNKIPDDYPKNL